jgi:thioredoxin-related protein
MLKTTNLLWAVIAYVLLCSCDNTNNKNQKVTLKKEFIEKQVQKEADMHLLLESSCLYCHRLQPIEGEKEIAPMMQVVVDVYKAKYPLKEDFIKSITAFTVNPENTESLMPSAVEIYGKMPNSAIDELDAQDLANFLFTYDFTQTQK